jgi:hypothetical protein
MEELFAPPAYEWQRLSPKYRSMRLLTTLIFVPILFTIPAIIVGVASGKWWISGVIWRRRHPARRLIFVPRNWRSGATSNGR